MLGLLLFAKIPRLSGSGAEPREQFFPDYGCRQAIAVVAVVHRAVVVGQQYAIHLKQQRSIVVSEQPTGRDVALRPPAQKRAQARARYNMNIRIPYLKLRNL